MKWQSERSYHELFFEQGSITIEPRPNYCDRGNFLAKLHPNITAQLAQSLDHQDGWPRYYFDLDRAKLECEAWLEKRKLVHEIE